MMDFVKTSPFFVHNSGPGDFEPYGLPHMADKPNDAEVESCVVAGARMGGGLQEQSQPMPLDDEQPLGGWERVQIAIYCLVAVASLLGLAGALQ